MHMGHITLHTSGCQEVCLIFLRPCKVAGRYGEGVVGATAESGISGEDSRDGWSLHIPGKQEETPPQRVCPSH